MSTDAFFFFHMDPENRLGEPSSPREPTSAPAHQPTASTSSSSVVSFRDRTRFLVEYSPKPTRVMYTPPQPVAAESSNSQAIHRWLAGQRPYTYIPDSERSSFSESESESEADNASTSSESESDEDQIYLRPRRQHSSPSIAIRRSSPIAASVSPAARRAWPVSAAKPALPVLDLREATAFTTQEQDKSHWSDDEEDFAEGEEEWADDDDLPALDADVDTGAASSSTRSLPIPIFNPPRTRSQPLLGAPSQKPCVNIDNWRPESPQNDFDALWDASYQSPVGRRAPCKAIQIQEGQSFYTPWIAGYIAQNN